MNAGAGQVLVIPGALDMDTPLKGTWEQRHKGKKSPEKIQDFIFLS